MPSILKKLFYGDDQREIAGDIAMGDWTPVPAGASLPALDMVEWLSAQVPPPPRRRRRTHAYLDHLSAEERRIVEEQRLSAREQEARVDAPPLPRPLPAAGRKEGDSWVEVLKSYGEHLTDAELAIIRDQLTG